MAFASAGNTPESLRAHAGDSLVTGALAEHCQLTPDQARGWLLGIAEAVESLPAAWVTPGYCQGCHQNHPGPCGCWCHQPAAAVPVQEARHG
jgi:hypothetical protein